MSAPRVLLPLGPGPTVLVIGYPTPTAVRVVNDLLATDARPIACVVAQEHWSEARSMHPEAQKTGRLRLFQGSASTPGLGLPHTAWRILDTADEIYGIASSEDIATGHVQEFADECPRLRELHLLAPDGDGAVRGTLRVRNPIRRVLRSLARVSARAALGRLTSAWSLGIAVIVRTGPLDRALRTWKDLTDLDIETALSWEEIERDLCAGDAA